MSTSKILYNNTVQNVRNFRKVSLILGRIFKFNLYPMKNYYSTHHIKYDKIKYLHIKIVINLLGLHFAT